MRAEAFTSRIKNVPEKISNVRRKVGNFIVGGPIEIPRSIKSLDLGWETLGETVLDLEETQRLNDVLLEIDVTSAIYAEKTTTPNEVALAVWGTQSEIPDAKVRSQRAKSARLRGLDLLNEFGLLRYARVSNNDGEGAAQIEARKGYRIQQRSRKAIDNVGIPFEQTIFIVERAIKENHSSAGGENKWSGFKVTNRKDWKTHGEMLEAEERRETRNGYHRLGSSSFTQEATENK